MQSGIRSVGGRTSRRTPKTSNKINNIANDNNISSNKKYKIDSDNNDKANSRNINNNGTNDDTNDVNNENNGGNMNYTSHTRATLLQSWDMEDPPCCARALSNTSEFINFHSSTTPRTHWDEGVTS